MKRLSWLSFAAIPIAAIAIFLMTRPIQHAAKTVAPPATKSNPQAEPIAVARMEFHEPILMLPEFEIVGELQVLVPDLNIPIGNAIIPFAEPVSVTTNSRPEAGREPRPWMDYAAEDRELADTRRLEWTKLLIRESPPSRPDFEETAEPPLFEPKVGQK
jgi:hypothetical protein